MSLPKPTGQAAVVITGASSGIGRATALAVARAGGVPLLVARSADKLEEVQAEIQAAGGSAQVYSCDITDEEAVAATVKQMVADHPSGIDFLVNNAGRSIRRSIQLSYDRMHDFERTIDLNYFAAVRMILSLLPHMTERQFGHIVNVSSIGVQTAPPRFAAYVASKAALDSFSRVVASETFGEGVTFTTIHMPLVRTPMIRPTRIYDAFPTLSPDDAADLVLRALTDRPKRLSTRLGTFGEVSYAVAPKLVDAVLHVAYRVFPDSKAAGGDDQVSLGRGAKAMARLLPGVHW
jgi:NAD(P)-dependent dehydrogenase (short-subunit alcohol dehydrogenase family)